MKKVLAVFLFAGLMASTAFAQEDSDLAKATQNPVSDLISLPFQNNFNFGFGPEDDLFYNLNIQPVYPMKLSENWNWIHRAILPVVDVPDPVNESGLGDIQYQGFFSPSQPGSLIWGAGPVVQFPSATDELLGTEKWSGGLGFVGLKISGPWVYGALVNNIWSFAGEDEREDVNSGLLQYFINYNFPSGLYITSAPVITVNWEADSGDQWTVPFGGGVGKILKLGKLPINTQISGYYNVERPDGSSDWQARLQFQLLFPK